MQSRYELFATSVSCMYHDIQKIERVEMAKYGLKGPHAQCLLAMSRFPEGITAARLCEICEKDKAAISRTVAQLVQQGLVVRPNSGYRALLRLSEEGVNVARQVKQKINLAVNRAGEGLTDADRKVFYAALCRIADNLKTISKEGLGT